MSWITIRGEVIGGKLRKLQKEVGCSLDEALGILVRLWLWGITIADENGRLPGTEREDIENVISKDLNRNLYPDDVLDALMSSGWIRADNGFVLDGWEEWQKEKLAFEKRRKQNIERVNRCRQKKKADVVPKPKVEKKPEPVKEKKKPESIYSKDFLDFWEIYPRKVDKGGAFKKYQARVNNGFSSADLMSAAKNYAEICKKDHTDERYILHAKTFLSDTLRFADYLPKNKDSGQKVEEGANPFESFRR